MASATVNQYYSALPENRKPVMQQLRETIRQHIPEGFEEQMSYGMPAFVVPHSIYPAGYHCKPQEALPFISLASQKNYIALHHMGLYLNEELLQWFTAAWEKQVPVQLNMGKGCIRFKKPENIPYELIGQLVGRITVPEWIALYESKLKK